MRNTSRIITPLLLVIELFASVLAQDLDSAMYGVARHRYQEASTRTVGQFYRLLYDPDPHMKWRDGPMRNKWLERAREKGALWIHSDSDFFSRKITYFSTFIQPNDEDPLSREMGLTQQLPSVVGGELPKEAAIFWKHVAGTFTPLKINFLTYHNAIYGLEPLDNVINLSYAQVHPLS
ncbi:uncharacterized protein SPSC_06105 [Sporisorium scitamineum]|uniref:Uncharacterized protein n=1 Tax=Sporisorium scitamineum TaxID=49012 RepID=A0A127ZIJ9_9BASI|nr:uncharacterized protein SPSC_06105 [Sporisorium scitamineum]